MSTLIERAKAVRVKTRDEYDEVLDVALAYARREVTGRQVQAARDSNGTQHGVLGSLILRAIRNGDLEVIDKRKR